MSKEKPTAKKAEELSEKSGFIAWVKEHKTQLLWAGISVTAVLLTILGLKNKDAINDFWNSLKKTLKEGDLFSDKWFKKASVEELYNDREVVQADYLNTKLDDDYRGQCWNLLSRLDAAIRAASNHGSETGFPVHSEHGWYLSSDD